MVIHIQKTSSLRLLFLWKTGAGEQQEPEGFARGELSFLQPVSSFRFQKKTSRFVSISMLHLVLLPPLARLRGLSFVTFHLCPSPVAPLSKISFP